MDRRSFLKTAGLAAAPLSAVTPQPVPKLQISLAEWSIHRAIGSGMVSNLDFPRIAREQFGIEGLEFVNGLWEAPTQDYVRRLKTNIERYRTQAVLIMCDGEGMMGHSERATRMKAAANHHKWVDIAAELGCHSIRTNMYPDRQPSTPAEIEAFIGHCTESFTNLCEYAKPAGVNVIIENHGGISSNSDVVVRLMKQVALDNFGTLPDFGNFPREIDRYEAVRKLMPYAKGVSFKCYDFASDGRETTLDMDRMLKVVNEAGYRNWVGIEFEGTRLTEFEGIQAARRLLERLLAV